jgi:hypothetical protein
MLLTLLLPLIIRSTNGDSFFKMGKNNKVKSFLNTISQIESSGGKNYNHDLIQKGIHTGDRAIGRYGLMPNTVNEVLNRMRTAGTITPELKKLKNLDHESLKSSLETNPELEDKIAETLADRVLTRQGDEDKAAYSWHQGHNMTPEQVDNSPYKEHDYVKKYNEYKKLTEGNEDGQ